MDYLGVYSKVSFSKDGQHNTRYFIAWRLNYYKILVEFLNDDFTKTGELADLTEVDFELNYEKNKEKSLKITPSAPLLEPAQVREYSAIAMADNEYAAQVVDDPITGTSVLPLYAKESKKEFELSEFFLYDSEANTAAPNASVNGGVLNHELGLIASMRKDFDLAIESLNGEHHAAAVKLIEKILKRKANFSEQDKHLFGDFGKVLRKVNLLSLSLHAYRKALELSSNDINLLFNFARVYYELGRLDKAKMVLTKALEVSPRFKEARNFLDFLEKNK